LKINTAGVIPPIFASSLLLLPTTAAQFAAGRKATASDWLHHVTAMLGYGQPLHMAIYAGLIMFFCVLLYGRCFQSAGDGR
jgi:preprotein translocase subunit SecY